MPPLPPPAPLPSPSPTSDSANDAPGVPGFRTWRGVYLFVLGVFVFIVIALTFFTRAYA
ncbi:MAG: hypothetical protein NTZ29_10075 [Verrucomicrobia bacterium]|nr:hypothetical protein [Verrucomicrobiota bacterium]